MPQVDNTTFLSIATWTFLAYVIGYLALNTTVLYAFLISLKIVVTRFSASCTTGLVGLFSLKPFVGFSLLSI